MKSVVIIAAFTALVAAHAGNGDAIRDRLDKYLIEYEPQLSSLVAAERMSQRDAPGPGAAVTAAPDTKHRSMESEVAFIGLPGDAGWLGFRRVVRVNGSERQRERFHTSDCVVRVPSRSDSVSCAPSGDSSK